VLLLLDDTSPSALVVDPAIPPSAIALNAVLVDAWPRLAGRVTFRAASLEEVSIEATDLVVSIHACGALADRVLERAAAAGARVAVVPCCHDAATCETGPAIGWVAPDVAIDLMRAVRLEQRGYHVRTLQIPASITPKNRLLVGAPAPE
jgi:hypothetical protein